MAKRLGLLIGINQYQDTAFRPLQFAENDARALAQWLVNTRGGKWNPSDIQLLLGEQATSKLTESLITQLCLKVADQDDLVFIYFAGHAFLDETRTEGYLAFANTHFQQPATGLSLLSLFNSSLLRSRSAQIVFVVDCFQTGLSWNRRKTSLFDFKPLPGSMLLQTLHQTQGRLLYCSCRGNEYAPEVGEKNLGKLLYYMIVGLCGPATDAISGQITLQNLHAFLVSSLNEQHQPQVFGQEQRPIVLVGNEMLEQNRLNQSEKLLNQARQQVQMQNYPAALHTIENVLLMAPDCIDALILKAQILGTSGFFQDALPVANRVIQLDQANALGWSMRATLLANMGQLHEASAAIERSITLNPNNPEALAIRDAILSNLARNSIVEQDAKSGSAATSVDKQGGARSFLLGAFIQIFALCMGTFGASILILRPQLPIIIAFLLESAALAILCVNAARGTYLYGIKRFLITFTTSLLALGALGALYKFGYNWFINKVIAFPPLIVPVLFLGLWLVAAAVLPFILAIGGFIGRITFRKKGP